MPNPPEALVFLGEGFVVARLVFSAVHILQWRAQREHFGDGGHLGQNYEFCMTAAEAMSRAPEVRAPRTHLRTYGGKQGFQR